MKLEYEHLISSARLLGSLPSRSQLKAVTPAQALRTIQIKVDRTMPFEFVSGLMTPFLNIWGAGHSVHYSDYDASLANLSAAAQIDVYVLWLDWRLYRAAMTAEAAVDWVFRRIAALSAAEKPVLINNWPENLEAAEGMFSPDTGKRGWIRELNWRLSQAVNAAPGCAVIDLAWLAHETEGPYYDERNDAAGHYPFSDKATAAIARHLAVQLLPSVLLPRLKAVALDLDDTLYRGVLGEDGIEGIRLTEGHLLLQKTLLELKQSGLLLTICSKNADSDVRALFAGRRDFPLQLDDFAAIHANWRPKAENLIGAAKQLNIDPSAFLFIDDNPAELLAMSAALPAVNLLIADRDGQETMKRLSHYPGLYQLRADASAALRTADIQANQIREQLKEQAGDHRSYLESLHMVVRIYENCRSHQQRLYEMSHKTNQFNLALHRLSEYEAEQAVNGEAYTTATVELSDRLTDSGIVGAFVSRVEGKKARLIETLFSCRALGRDIETVAFARYLKILIGKGVSKLDIAVSEGPKNAPARQWLASLINGGTDQIPIDELYERVLLSCFNHPAKVEEIQ